MIKVRIPASHNATPDFFTTRRRVKTQKPINTFKTLLACEYNKLVYYYLQWFFYTHMMMYMCTY